ncbi:DUF5753 domain-containing protein [Uniformispora flossi]|uniref:DUF5753 domain-containing protein n=1 Tax=Uniformispora flossi TaxID=3390723 RepID=UPI003C2AFB62
MQTANYARGLMRASLPYAPRTEIESHVQARLERGKLLDRSNAPEIWAVIHEACFGITVGSPQTMAAQLTHLRDLSAGDSPVIVQVMPGSAGPHPLMYGSTILMTFDDAPSIAYNEGAHTAQLIEDPALVSNYMRSYHHVRAAALSPAASLTVLESAVRAYRT